jgi:hypothetical protein
MATMSKVEVPQFCPEGGIKKTERSGHFRIDIIRPEEPSENHASGENQRTPFTKDSMGIW